MSDQERQKSKGGNCATLNPCSIKAKSLHKNQYFFFTLHAMTSPLATNAVILQQGDPRYLQTDINGYPLQGQVAITVETYTGAGGESIVPEGKNVFLASGLGTGDLTLDLTDTADYYNMIGRSMLVYVLPSAANDVVIDITGGSRAFRLTGDTGDVATITPGGYAHLWFVDRTNCLISANANCTTA
jgi:hypothetical protein